MQLRLTAAELATGNQSKQCKPRRRTTSRTPVCRPCNLPVTIGIEIQCAFEQTMMLCYCSALRSEGETHPPIVIFAPFTPCAPQRGCRPDERGAEGLKALFLGEAGSCFVITAESQPMNWPSRHSKLFKKSPVRPEVKNHNHASSTRQTEEDINTPAKPSLTAMQPLAKSGISAETRTPCQSHSPD